MKSKFLHNHPQKEKTLGLDENHVIVDREDWEKARELINDQNPKISDRISGHFGLSARVIAIDEARHILGHLPNLIFIAGEDIRKYPELPTNELDEISDKVKYGKLQLTVSPETLNAFERMNEQAMIAASEIKSLSDEFKAYDRENNPKKKHKGHERPYKFHR